MSLVKTVDLETIIEEASKERASDVHLCAGKPVIFRVDGILRPAHKLTPDPLQEKDILTIFDNYMSAEARQRFETRRSYDVSFSFENTRVRVHFYETMNGVTVNCRLIPLEPIPLDDLNVPQIIKKWLDDRGGLIIISGLANMGKTTTIASSVDYINNNYNQKILILEDPIEFIHKDRLSYIFQREIGTHSPDYAQALKDVLRENVDTVVVGEVRDAKAMDAVFTMAEDGLKVITSVHALRAIDTVERIVNMFPAADHERVYRRLSWTLKGIINQWLIPKKAGGRILATEVVSVTDAIKNLLKEGKPQQIRSYLDQGGSDMYSLESCLNKLHLMGLITRA
jgi:twitching motility protein PilT